MHVANHEVDGHVIQLGREVCHELEVTVRGSLLELAVPIPRALDIERHGSKPSASELGGQPATAAAKIQTAPRRHRQFIEERAGVVPNQLVIGYASDLADVL